MAMFANVKLFRRGLASAFEGRGFVPRSRVYASTPPKFRRLRRDAPVKRPSENDSASLNEWESAVDILKRGRSQSGISLTGGLRIALLIDAENITYKNVDGIMNEVEKLGIIQIRRIYADWTSEIMRGWRQTVLTNALTPVHQFQSSIGKGNTDSMMIIDAMDILYKNKDIESFCIVSSDADFTRLATKLREEGKLVLGIGSNLTPAPFVVACNRFVYLHNLVKEESAQQAPQAPVQAFSALISRPSAPAAAIPSPIVTAKAQLAKQGSPSQPTAQSPSALAIPLKTKAKIDMTQRDVGKIPRGSETRTTVNNEALRAALPLFTRAWATFRMDNGWAPLMGMSSELQRIQPDFAPGAFGPFARVEDLLEATDAFEVKRVKSAPSATLIRRVMNKAALKPLNAEE